MDFIINMKIKTLMKKLIITTLIFILQCSVNAASFKCWTNTDGVKECGNSIPPQYAKQRIQFHNTKSGNVKEVKEAAKSKEQLLKEKEEERIRLLREKEIAKQNTYDDVLLKTYLTIDDLLLSLNWKITTLDSQIKIAQGNIKNLDKQFIDKAMKAAQSERKGAKIPNGVKKELDTIRHKISLKKEHIKKLENDKSNIHQKFKHDAERFTVATINALSHVMGDRNNPKTKFLSQIKCTTATECEKIWESAKQFVKSNSNLPIIFETDTICVNESPKNASDYALTVSNVEPISFQSNTTGKLITLELRCDHSPEGEQACENKRVKEILADFKSI